MDGGVSDLAIYRLENAKGDFGRATKAYEDSDYKLTLIKNMRHRLQGVAYVACFDVSDHV